MKEKIKEIYDNVILDITLLYRNIKQFFRGISRWFSYYKVIHKLHDFDWSDILVVEQHQLSKLRDCINKYHDYEGWEEDVKWMNISLSLLDIVLGDGVAEIVEDHSTFNGEYYVPAHVWRITTYVNINNASRFVNNFYVERLNDPNCKISEILKSSLRDTKAWYLYNKIRINKLKNWWI